MLRIPAAGPRLLWALAGVLSVGVAAIEPARTQPSATAAAPIPNGTWTVQGREIPGTRCGHWLVRLANRDGILSGVVSLARASVPIQDLKMRPDGSFSGTTSAGVVGSRHARPYTVEGQFTGDTVHLRLETDRCPPRSGSATRH